MADFRGNFTSRAFQVVSWIEYNRARRELLERADIIPVIYEVTLPEQGSWETFRDREFPLLVRCLKSHRVDPEYARMLVVAAFLRDQCYFVDGVEWMKAWREIEDLNSEALHFRVLRWLAETEAAPS